MKDPKIQAYEQHQRLFAEHVKHFELLDRKLELFAREHQFELEKNQWHRPCRVLRKKGTLEYIVEISQDGDWKNSLYQSDLPHTVSVVAQSSDSEHVYRLNSRIADAVSFSLVERNLTDYLTTALDCIQKWTLPVLVRDGEKSVHPLTHYARKGFEPDAPTD